MNRDQLNRPQNACSFESPPADLPPSPPPRWLAAMSGKARFGYAWLDLYGFAPEDSPLMRSLARAHCESELQFVDEMDRSAMLIKGPLDELDRIKRLCDADEFRPGMVHAMHLGALPVPSDILKRPPRGGQRYLLVVGFDPDSAPKLEILRLVSRDAGVNLDHVRREPVGGGIVFSLGGLGDPRAIGACVAMHSAGGFPSPHRAGVVRLVESLENNRPGSPDLNRDELLLEIDNSSEGQLHGFLSRIDLKDFGQDVIILGHERAPISGLAIGAHIEIAMKPRPANVRGRIEDHVRAECARLEMKGRCSWLVNGVWVARPDLV